MRQTGKLHMGPTPGPVIKSRVRAPPFASLRTYSSKPFSSLSRTACTARRAHNLPAKLRLVLATI
jgi:hypothetical protein